VGPQAAPCLNVPPLGAPSLRQRQTQHVGASAPPTHIHALRLEHRPARGSSRERGPDRSAWPVVTVGMGAAKWPPTMQRQLLCSLILLSAWSCGSPSAGPEAIDQAPASAGKVFHVWNDPDHAEVYPYASKQTAAFKVATVMARRRESATAARRRLVAARGLLRSALEGREPV